MLHVKAGSTAPPYVAGQTTANAPLRWARESVQGPASPSEPSVGVASYETLPESLASVPFASIPLSAIPPSAPPSTVASAPPSGSGRLATGVLLHAATRREAPINARRVVGRMRVQKYALPSGGWAGSSTDDEEDAYPPA